MFSAHYKLDNLCIIVDVNGLQIDGRTKDVMNTEPLDEKFTAFGCDVVKIDGHDFEQIESAFPRFHANHGSGKPTCILMRIGAYHACMGGPAQAVDRKAFSGVDQQLPPPFQGL